MKNRFSKSLIVVLPFLLCFCLIFSSLAFAEDTGGYTISIVSEEDDSAQSVQEDSAVKEIEEEEVPLASAELLEPENDSNFTVIVIASAVALIACFIVVKIVIDRRNDKKFAEKLGVDYPF